MKKLLPFLMLIISLSAFAQVPAYYNDVNLNLTGNPLKDELATKIISTHTTFLSYTPGVWNVLKQTDLDPNDPTRVKLIYGWNDTDSDITNDYTRDRDQNGGGSGVWNREHVYSKSLGSPNLGTSGAGADAHNLRPCDAQRNSSRSNRKFAAGSGTASYITPQGNWYPGDEWKGDVARMMMYMYLRYGNQTLPNNVGIGNPVATDNNMIDLFLQWNAEDPVSPLEEQRNPIMEIEQGNRNPFIDNPALATQIWGGSQAEDLFGTGNNGDTQAPTAPTALVSSNVTQTTVDLAWSASSDNTAVTGYQVLNGTSIVGNSTTTNYTVTGLTAGTSYSFTIKAFDAANNVSASSNSVTVTTLTGGGSGNGTTTELLISEYVEGSSYNKAIEIANFTGNTVNLSNYSLKKATNGSGSFSSTLNLSGSLANGQVYVIAHTSANATIQATANLTNGGVMNFNGNDAIALYKNNAQIDLVGNPNSSANFGKDVTLERKSSVTSPNTSYVVAEWNQLAKDTFSGLGDHTIDGGSTADTTAPSVPTNLIASNISQTSLSLNWNSSSDNTAVTGYDIYQNDIKVATVNTTNFNVSGLDIETAYNYAITAFDAAGNISAQSTKVFITTLAAPDTQAPTAPSSLVSSNTTQTSVNLAWSASTDNSGVTGYDVYQGNTVITTVTGTNYAVSGLNANTNYNFSIRAKDAAGNVSNASNSVSVTTLAAPDTQAPTAPSSLVASNTTQTSVNLAWSASTDNSGVTGYDVYQGNTVITTVTTTSYSVTGLNADTNYSFSVRAKDAAGNVSNASNSVSVTTLPNVVSYCSSKGNNINYEYIDNVVIGGISNATGANGGYGDFTSQTGNLSVGNNTIVVSAGFTGSSYTENWRVWIDFNQNGTFETSEQVVSGSSSSAGNLSYTFSVPSSALTGATRMRVSMKWNGTPTACETFSYGEVEDYTVNIGVAARGINATTVTIDGELRNEASVFSANIFPNPASNFVRIQMADDRNANYRIVNMMGQKVRRGEVSHANINVQDLQTGMYILEVNDGQRSFTKKFAKK